MKYTTSMRKRMGPINYHNQIKRDGVFLCVPFYIVAIVVFFPYLLLHFAMFIFSWFALDAMKWSAQNEPKNHRKYVWENFQFW